MPKLLHVAQSLGVPAQDTIPLTEPKDTQEEAYEVEKLLENLRSY